ncbi:MBL fold metallo-hydrolase [Mycobacterium branderi]|uniref:Hydrolase n=1 Tax=Mycobacterium branderi TaxID=43348 RepID=A0A7I7W8U9_9MYCO|nr:MBL fold metallo-hydrolase [Mycobacterium branderi]MCV7235881.1 MBL fold metallo-hydrolase [Mycobacterium branderi]ORA31126.1 hydrolase [Mycobacterium branderi]BBZ14049.1 hydrolase [Mycobacterium branderi]
MFWLCRTCGVEHATASELCAICADERQWVPREGQQWATLEELAAEGMRSEVTVIEDGLVGIGSSPALGIGQVGKLVCTKGGNVLWDPSGFVDDAAIAAVTEHGPVVGIVASHPHMYGAQVEWSHRLGGVPVYVNAADAEWVMRPDPVIRHWSDTLELTPSLSVVRVGGHFPGSAVACWSDGADGRGVLLVGDTVFPNPDRRTVGFLRSYPNRLPLSAAVVLRMADTLAELRFDRIYGLFTNAIDSDGQAAVRRSAARHAAWVRGDYDYLT